MFVTSSARLARDYGSTAERQLRRALERTVDEVGAIAATERIDCHYRKGGRVMLARNPSARTRNARSNWPARSRHGRGGPEAPRHARGPLARGRHQGAGRSLHAPLRLPAPRPARPRPGWVRRQGAARINKTPVVELAQRRVVTAHGTVLHAKVIVKATEGFSAAFGAAHRQLIPFYSLMVATEPLDQGLLDEIGLRNGEAFVDLRHLVIYGQRTADGRIAFGGRGAPYHYASRVKPEFDRDGRIHHRVHRTLVELFPALAGTPVTHRWGGPLGIARDWHPSVGFDPATGFGWAGGYVGDGVAVTNLAGRTLAALITGGQDESTQLCWVGHRRATGSPSLFVGSGSTPP